MLKTARLLHVLQRLMPSSAAATADVAAPPPLVEQLTVYNLVRIVAQICRAANPFFAWKFATGAKSSMLLRLLPPLPAAYLPACLPAFANSFS
mmetsp:Transcript_102977/g.199526  ORF Transcript_102977/g.199526 Transcript_102977/m.199526 type:complete len:93 (-) Transcript_102977:31-309(-)